MRKTNDNAFKTKVVLEALKEEQTLQELGQKYDVHPNQIGQWKKQALEAMPDIFERPNKKSASEREEQMLKTIGTQKIEMDFLKKVSTIVRPGPGLIEKDHPDLSVRRQSELLGFARSSAYYQSPSERDQADLDELQEILSILEVIPFYGYRKVAQEMKKRGTDTTPKRVRRVMRKFGLKAIFAKPDTSKSRKEHKKYPYLLSGKVIRYPNQVGASDITYLRLPSGHVYLVVILDLYSRKLLSWRLSNSMKADFCIEALARYGSPAIFNTDQGSQFTSEAFTSILKNHQIQISMDGKGRALDNIYVERLWRTLKYEDIFIKSYETMSELKYGLNRYFHFYNTMRFHQSLEYQVPDEKYQSFQVTHNEVATAA